MKAAQRIKYIPEVSLSEHRVPGEDATKLILGTQAYASTFISHYVLVEAPKDRMEQLLDIEVRAMMMNLAEELALVASKLREAAR